MNYDAPFILEMLSNPLREKFKQPKLLAPTSTTSQTNSSRSYEIIHWVNLYAHVDDVWC